MTLMQVCEHNREVWEGKTWLNWRMPMQGKSLSPDNLIEVTDPDHPWYGMIGYLRGFRLEDDTVALYLPMTKTKGQAGIIKWDKCRRIGLKKRGSHDVMSEE